MMKQIYTDIKPATGYHNAGICSVYVIPRQWLLKDPVIDYDTGRVLSPPELLLNTFWIRIDLLPATYKFDESPKSSKSGDYKELEISGEINFYNYMLRQQLETLRRSDLVVLLTDKNRRRRLIGDKDMGMKLSYRYSIADGEEKVTVQMNAESEDPAPYYNPDGEPEIIYNLLENLDGNFLLIA